MCKLKIFITCINIKVTSFWSIKQSAPFSFKAWKCNVSSQASAVPSPPSDPASSSQRHSRILAQSGHMSVIHTPIHNTFTDLLVHRAAGMSPGKMTPVRLQDTDRQHNRSAESSVKGTIVFLGNKAQSEQRSAAHQPALVGNRVMDYTAPHNTLFVEVPEYIIAVCRFRALGNCKRHFSVFLKV